MFHRAKPLATTSENRTRKDYVASKGMQSKVETEDEIKQCRERNRACSAQNRITKTADQTNEHRKLKPLIGNWFNRVQ